MNTEFYYQVAPTVDGNIRHVLADALSEYYLSRNSSEDMSGVCYTLRYALIHVGPKGYGAAFDFASFGSIGPVPSEPEIKEAIKVSLMRFINVRSPAADYVWRRYAHLNPQRRDSKIAEVEGRISLARMILDYYQT